MTGAHTQARWRRRTLAERASALEMCALAQRFEALNPRSPGVPRALRRAAEDERRHAGLCEQVLAQLGLDSPPEHAARPALPPSESGDLPIALVEHVVFLLCAGESIAAAMLRAAAEGASAPGVAELLTGIAKDESGHAALGWAALDAALLTLSVPAQQAAAGPATRQALRAVVAASLVGPVDADSAAWGLLDEAQAQAIAQDVLRHGVAPELMRRGLWAPPRPA
ncbi:MAG: ferritin-like domain-containing protein [Alphaproteobacteria bacterium]|nr:ferritin-like domain-containing protein [Alphaproteobacteria bacterium]